MGLLRVNTISATTFYVGNGKTIIPESGIYTNAFGPPCNPNAEQYGANTKACGDYSHTQGLQTSAATTADYSHAEGLQTITYGLFSHAEGGNTQAIGEGSHAEGGLTQSIGIFSHAEGRQTIASGYASHSAGFITTAIGDYSFVHGNQSTAHSLNTIVLGANIQGYSANTTYVDKFNIKTANPISSATNLCIDSDGNVVKANYNSYLALISYNLTDVTVIELHNTLGYTPTWSGVSKLATNSPHYIVGTFNGNILTSGKTYFSVGNGVENERNDIDTGWYFTKGWVSSASAVTFAKYDFSNLILSNAPIPDQLEGFTRIPVEIRVYN
jgi:hypothetical protein